jgi:glycosyltransferase involved in cell wall biosynthesis
LKILFIQPYVSYLGVLSDTLPGNLAKKGHEVDLISFAGDNEKRCLIHEVDKIRIHHIDGLNISIPNCIDKFPYLFSLEQTIRQIQPDIIHANNLTFLTTFQSTKLSKKSGIKNIVQVHGVMSDRGFLLNSAQKAFILTFGRSIFSCADKIFCLTDKNAQKTIGLGCPADKIAVIPNGVDTRKFHPSIHTEENLLLWCGRFVREKGLEYLVDAIRIIVKEKGRSNIVLLLIGSGPLLSRIQNLTRAFGLQDNIVFRGPLSHEELPNIMNRASLFVLPSLMEGMPYVLLETMACGVPVVGSNIPGINEIVKPGVNGLLVPPQDPRTLASAILSLLDDEMLRRSMGQKAREAMVENFDWNSVVSMTEKAYDNTLAS